MRRCLSQNLSPWFFQLSEIMEKIRSWWIVCIFERGRSVDNGGGKWKMRVSWRFQPLLILLSFGPNLLFFSKFAPNLCFSQNWTQNFKFNLNPKVLWSHGLKFQFENEVQYRFLSRINSRTSENYSISLIIKIRGISRSNSKRLEHNGVLP